MPATWVIFLFVQHSLAVFYCFKKKPRPLSLDARCISKYATWSTKKDWKGGQKSFAVLDESHAGERNLYSNHSVKNGLSHSFFSTALLCFFPAVNRTEKKTFEYVTTDGELCLCWKYFGFIDLSLYEDLCLSQLQNVSIPPEQNKRPNSKPICHILSYIFSAKGEAVLHSAHSEETLGAEEKTRDVVCAALLLHGQPESCSYNYCHSKEWFRITLNIFISQRCDR